MEATPLALDGKVLTTGEVPNTYILGTVQGAKILMPHGQKNKNVKQKRYCNKLNKDIYSRISVKIRLKKGKSVLLKSKVLPPLPLPLQRSGDTGPSGCYGQEHRVSSPPSSQVEGFLPEEAGLQHLGLGLLRLNARQVWLGSGGSILYTKAHVHQRLSQVRLAGNARNPNLLLGFMRWWFQVKLDWLLPYLPSSV